jgi:hypothetical protein
MLIKGHTGRQGEWGIDSFIHVFGARLGRVVNATLRLLCPWKEPRYPLCRRMFGPHRRYRWVWKIGNDLAPTMSRTQTFQRVTRRRAEYVIPPLPSPIVQNIFFSMPSHVPDGLRGLPSRLWPKCNRLLRLRCLWGSVTFSRWGGWWYMNMKYQKGP